MSLSDFSEVDIEEFDDLIASPLSSPRKGTTIDLSNHHPVDMAPVPTPLPSKLGPVSSDGRVGEQYARSPASEQSSLASSPGFSSTYKKHDRFYFDDGNITFLVEDVLYNVHRYFFCRDSPFFVNLISNRCGDPSISFSQPFVLKDIGVEEFDALLCILYPLDFDECEVKTVAGWTSILRLSTQWSLTSVRKLAISKLGPIASSVDKIVLGRTYSVNAWLTPGFVAICQRPQPLTRHEGRRLGVDDAILVACLRESFYGCSTKPRAEDITTTVQACLTSPSLADKGLIPFTVSDTPSTNGLHTAIPSDPEPSGSSHLKPIQPSANDADVRKQLHSMPTEAMSKVVSKTRTAKDAAKPKSEIATPFPVPTTESKTAVTADAPPPRPPAAEPTGQLGASAIDKSLASSFSGLTVSTGKVASGWGGGLKAPSPAPSATGGWGSTAKTPSAAASAAGGWGSPAKTPGRRSKGSSTTKGATGWGSQSKTPAAIDECGSAGTAAGWGLTGGAEENKDGDSWNLRDESEANESNNAGSNKGWGLGGWGGSGADSDKNNSTCDLVELDTAGTSQ